MKANSVVIFYFTRNVVEEYLLGRRLSVSIDSCHCLIELNSAQLFREVEVTPRCLGYVVCASDLVFRLYLE